MSKLTEKVHPAKERGDRSSLLGGEVKGGFEVQCSGIVHGELDTKAAGVLDEEQPSIDIHGTRTEGSSSRYFSHGSVLLQLCVVTLGTVVGEFDSDDAHYDSNTCRNNADSPPCLFCTHATRLEEREEN